MKPTSTVIFCLLPVFMLACSSPEKKKPLAKFEPPIVATQSPKKSAPLHVEDRIYEPYNTKERSQSFPKLYDTLLGKDLKEKKGKRNIVGQGTIDVSGALDFDNEEARAQMSAAKTLGRYGDKREIPILIKALGSDNYRLRDFVGRALYQLSRREPAVKGALIEAFKKSPSHVRKEIIETLSCLPLDKNLKRIYENALSDPNVDIRVCAARTISRTYGTDALEWQINCFLSKDRFLQRVAAEELVRLSRDSEHSSKEAKDRIFESLKKGLLRPHSFRPISAAKALGEIGEPRALPPLVQSLNVRDSVTRRWTYSALEKLIKEKSCRFEKKETEVLIQYLSHKQKDIRSKAARILGLARVEEARAKLTELAKNDKKSQVQEAAKAALRDLDQRKNPGPTKNR